uniref:Uncharacterized protein n=1 Tax=Physcomitrium patens TaxID=3218 RepID=A0A2K1K817_PHYPA|nr:hypothetical protein PHYPA_011818 [Physcomitrium patens]
MSREHDKILKEKVLHILLLGDIHVNGRFTDERNVKKLPPTASDFNLTFSTWSPNTVAGCFTTFRELVVAVRYRGDLILRQEVQLEFSLTPSGTRGLVVRVKGEQASLRQQLGPVLEAELQCDRGQFVVKFYFETRYLIADRRSRWKHFGCQVVATTPQKGLGTKVSTLDRACWCYKEQPQWWKSRMQKVMSIDMSWDAAPLDQQLVLCEHTVGDGHSPAPISRDHIRRASTCICFSSLLTGCCISGLWTKHGRA